ncbi:LutC/YkgG family protein [Allorhodopirellula heiligendammensis]|uniref:Lactate utilization protein C n=1 Tax=Allorhodopirellula heiligendammensis TaxID=2714739 RepID=A0A5C6BYJ0_9BACT|nr:LUD domain-containing protein [Allorhodopirellula heiligendammensis]TWU16902.1 Lactate utilization protein C [Allorhodopirellula heiligendammensis]
MTHPVATAEQSHSRQVILDRLRGRMVDAPDLPQIDPGRLIRFDDPVAHFEQTLGLVGGQSHRVQTHAEIRQILSDLDEFKSAQRIASTVPEAVAPTVDLSSTDDPHTLASLDWTIVRGEFGVAENGSIWIDGATLPHRVMIFIAQYLAIVISREQLVDQMHQAYMRIGTPAPGFGVFVSGPSKTADIEQSLVLGAHGCRKLQVFLLP